jgi:hypothetical protein
MAEADWFDPFICHEVRRRWFVLANTTTVCRHRVCLWQNQVGRMPGWLLLISFPTMSSNTERAASAGSESGR